MLCSIIYFIMSSRDSPLLASIAIGGDNYYSCWCKCGGW